MWVGQTAGVCGCTQRGVQPVCVCQQRECVCGPMPCVCVGGGERACSVTTNHTNVLLQTPVLAPASTITSRATQGSTRCHSGSSPQSCGSRARSCHRPPCFTTASPAAARQRASLVCMCAVFLLQGFVIAGVWYMYAPDKPAPKKPTAGKTAAAAAKKDEGAAAGGEGAGDEAEVTESNGSKPAATRATRRRA